MKDEKLKGAHVALVAMGKSNGNYNTALANGCEYDEVWGINVIGAIMRVDRVFMMDPASRFLDSEVAGTQTKPMRKMLTTKQSFPIYTCVLDERCPSLVEYPLEDVIRETQLCYFNNTAAYALAFAAAQGIGKISLFGLDYGYRHNVFMAEAGRACSEFWLATLAARGVQIEVAPESTLLDTNTPENEKLYGYHRLADPLVVESDGMNVTIRRMSMAQNPPEPKDPVLYKG